MPFKAQNWSWAKGCINNGFGFGEGTSVCLDPSGNVYTTGWYSDQMVAGNYTLNAGGSGCTFLIKYNPNGNVLWAQSSSTAGFGVNNWAVSNSSDANGNVFIAGYFTANVAIFGPYILSTPCPTNMFLVKYDSNGNVLWARSPTDTTGNYAFSVSCDTSNNVYVAGTFFGTSIVFGTYTLTSSGSDNLFLVKYDPNGNVLWAKTPTGSVVNDQYGSVKVSAEANGNTFVTGGFVGPTITFGTYTLTNGGTNCNIFLVKYAPNGNVIWAKSASGSGKDVAYSVSTDGIGNAYISGEYYSSPLVFGTYSITGGGNLFLAKYDANGNALWVRNSVGGGSHTGSLSSVSSNSNSVIVLGTLANNISGWGAPVTLSNYTLYPPVIYNDPIFLAQYDVNGNLTYANTLASGGDDWKAVCLDKYCNAYITGDFAINPFIVGSNTLVTTGGPGENAFVAKLSFSTADCLGTLDPEPTGVNVLQSSSEKFMIFPNPNSGSFKIQIGNDIQNGEIILINSTGQKVFEQKIIQGTNEIKTFGLPIGLYNYILFCDNQSFNNGKVTIE